MENNNYNIVHIENELDQYIFDGAKLRFVVEYRKLHDCDLKTAAEALGKRFRVLKAKFPDKLPTEAEFFEGFYT